MNRRIAALLQLIDDSLETNDAAALVADWADNAIDPRRFVIGTSPTAS